MNLPDSELHAYVDDRLDAEGRRAVEARLAQAPEDAARAAAYREQNAAFHAAYDAVLDEPVPERLRHIDVPRRALPRFAVAAGWLALGALGGWLGHALLGDRPYAVASFPHQAAIAHAVYSPEVRHPVEVAAAEQEHLVNWLSKRVGATLRAPVLSGEGYELVGGRLLPGETGAVAQFMYQDAKGKRLTLYVSRLAGKQRDTAFRFSQEDKVSVFYWIDGALGYALSGELPKAELLKVATTVYKQLNP
jgi:anti-sigma factor RsiW